MYIDELAPNQSLSSVGQNNNHNVLNKLPNSINQPSPFNMTTNNYPILTPNEHL